MSLLADQFFQGATIAKLIDEVKIIAGLEHVDILDNILALTSNLREDIDFIDSALF
jgi:hypothetical protein